MLISLAAVPVPSRMRATSCGVTISAAAAPHCTASEHASIVATRLTRFSCGSGN